MSKTAETLIVDRSRTPCLVRTCARQMQDESGALQPIDRPRWTDMDSASMPAHDLLRNPQTQTGAHILFGGEEWVEDAIHQFGSDARAVVLNEHFCDSAMIRLRIVASDRDLALVRYRINCVGDEVGNHLLEFS